MICVVDVLASVVPANSRKRSLRIAPGVSARTHRLPVYVPAVVLLTESGESFKRHERFDAAVFVICAAQDPVCPPCARESVTSVGSPLPDVFHPF